VEKARDAELQGGQMPSGSTDATPLLEVRNLTVRYRSRGGIARRHERIDAVNDITLHLPKGATIGLVGESGSGKSTLGKAIVRLERPYGGAVLLDGIDIFTLPERNFRPMRRRLQMIYQDSLASMNPRFTVGETIAEPLVVHRIGRRDQRSERVAELLAGVGLDSSMCDKLVVQLSGGERQRVNIARALASGPEVVIADEPTSSLDVSLQAQVLKLLKERQRQDELSVLFISHDLAVIRSVAATVAVMYLGKLVEVARRDDLFSMPLHPYSRALLLAAPQPDPRAERQRDQAPIPGEIPSPVDPPRGCRFHPRCAMASDICAAVEPQLRQVVPGHWSACHFAEALGSDPATLSFMEDPETGNARPRR